MSRTAVWARRLALFALVTSLLSIFIVRSGVLEMRPALATLAGALAFAVAAIVLAFAVGGCATAPIGGPVAPPAAAQPAAPVPRNAEPPPPPINLSGFPLPYRQGYADGCASIAGTERKDAARFAGDPNYRTGWQDGLALCRKK